MHAINNLLQKDMATPQDFDDIAAAHVEIAGKGPLLHRLGLGDYDANTVISFLQERANCQVEFIDRRSPRDAIQRHLSNNNDDNSTNLKGFLVNTIRQRSWVPTQIISSRHWISVVWIGGANDDGTHGDNQGNEDKEWYIIDSSKDKVEKITDILGYMEQIQNDDKLDANLMAVREVSSSNGKPTW